LKEILGTQYVLAVHDLKRSVSYYIEELGFELFSEPPGWAFLRRESFIVMLGECRDAIDPKDLGDHSYFAYINVSNAEAIFHELSAKQVTIRKELESEPWGMKEFAIETIDGHRIMFGEAL